MFQTRGLLGNRRRFRRGLGGDCELGAGGLAVELELVGALWQHHVHEAAVLSRVDQADDRCPELHGLGEIGPGEVRDVDDLVVHGAARELAAAVVSNDHPQLQRRLVGDVHRLADGDLALVVERDGQDVGRYGRFRLRHGRGVVAATGEAEAEDTDDDDAEDGTNDGTHALGHGDPSS